MGTERKRSIRVAVSKIITLKASLVLKENLGDGHLQSVKEVPLTGWGISRHVGGKLLLLIKHTGGHKQPIGW